MKSVVIIPARYQSSRYPGKPLVPLNGKPMILWVAELSSSAVGRENVYVATDSTKISGVVIEAGFRCVMTGAAETGTDRLAEVAERVDADIYINVQGDEPLLCPESIKKAIDAKKESMGSIINAYCKLLPSEDPRNTNLPKVVVNESGNLLYMSRAPVPATKSDAHTNIEFKKQVCVYAFTKRQLADFKAYGRKSETERIEDIEILRFLDLGYSVKMFEVPPGGLAVDAPEDVPGVEAALRERNAELKGGESS